MKIRFLVFLAVICFVSLAQANETVKVDHKQTVTAVKTASEKNDRDKKVTRDVNFEDGKKVEETKTLIRDRREKDVHEKVSKKDVRKEVRRIEKLEDCSEAIKEHKESCEKKCVKGYKPIFTYIERKDECDWNCDYEALPTTPKPLEKKVVTVKREKPKKHLKECSGERSFKVQNCHIKLTGLMAWGDKVNGFDRKFQRLLNRKKKAAKKH